MTENMDDGNRSNGAAAVEPENLDAQRKKYSRMLSSGLFDERRAGSNTGDPDAETAPRSSSKEYHKTESNDKGLREEGDEDDTAQDLTETEKANKAVKNMLLMVFGVGAPVLAIICWGLACTDRITLLLLKHPVEFLVEAAAILNIPLANYLVQRATSRQDLRFPLRNGILIGMAAGTTLLIAVVATVAVSLGYPAMDIHNESRAGLFATIAAVCLASCICSIILALELRNTREFRSARRISMVFSIGGLLAAILMLVGAETRPLLVRIAEANATSDVIEERDSAIEALKKLDAERDMRMECSDQRAAGIPGMFIKMDPVMQRQVYFMLAGKPFRDEKASDYSAMPDDYLRRHVVGAPVENLALARSAMTGTVSSNNLVSSINWTFVLKNRNYSSAEARAELILPPGAVINGVTHWAGEGSAPRTAHVGIANHGVFTPSREMAGIDVTDLGRDRILVRCSNIAAQSETKLSLSIAAPLTLNDLKSASLTLPRFIDTNFNALAENTFRLRSKTPLVLEGKSITASQNDDGEYLISGELKGKEIKETTLTLDTTRDASSRNTVSAYDRFTRLYFTRSIANTKSSAPRSLMVVVDGSDSMKQLAKPLVESLKKLPNSISTSVFIASNNKAFSNEPMTIKDALNKISNNPTAFTGGQDNLQTVVKAAGVAGETRNGAVLWIHGPQAGLNKELYITTPYTETPKFYEISVDSGASDATELFKNHREIGPFTTISRSNDIAADLKRFINGWQPGSSAYELKYTTSSRINEDAVKLEGQEAREFLSVCFKQEYDANVTKGKNCQAGQLAYAGNIVTPDTSAVIAFSSSASPAVVAQSAQESRRDNSESLFTSEKSADAFQQAPNLSGATNGIIGPQGSDAFYVTGVNTAGTVRVNNIANLEALLNIMCNGFELLCLVGGGALILRAIVLPGEVVIFGTTMSRLGAGATGAFIAVTGVATPGMVNWLIASARDANLFS